MTKRFRFLFAILSMIIISTGFANAQQRHSIKATFIDESTNEAVEFATVSVYDEKNKETIAYALTDGDGFVEIKKIKAGTYILKAELLGYEPYSSSMTIFENDIDYGKLKMKVQVNYLEGATVTGVGNPIIIKKDTIEYNASSFKTTDSDMLYELLKKLPGIEVSSDGSITANGKTIDKITVDGKTFFMDDPQLAVKNIPAKIIEKVKVLEKKSEESEFTGINDGEEEYVIDVGVKQGMMNGWMGNLSGGLGTDLRPVEEGQEFGEVNDPRFTGNGMMARFSNSDQIALIGNANNANNRGFGGGGGMGGGMMGGGGRGGRGGINTSYMGGVTASHIWGDDNELAGNYRLSGNNNYAENNSYKTTFLQNGTTLLNDEISTSENDQLSHSGSVRLEWDITDRTSIVFEPQISYSTGSFLDESTFRTDNGNDLGQYTGKVNDGTQKSFGDNQSLSTSGRFIFRQRIGSKAGRTLTVNINYSLSKDNTDGFNDNVNNIYKNGEIDEIASERARVDQKYNQLSNNQNYGARFNYTDYLGGDYFLQLQYSLNYRDNSSQKNTFDKDALGNHTVKDRKYSNEVTNTTTEQSIGATLLRQTEKLYMSVGASANPSKLVSTTVIDDTPTTIEQNPLNWSPNARIEYEISDYSDFQFTYRGRTTQPSVNQLNPVEDNSNPLRITRGNPNLSTSFNHNLNAEYFKSNPAKFSSLMLNVGGSYTNNGIINANWITNEGVTYNVPMNDNRGSYSMNGMVMFNSPINRSDFSIMTFTMASYSNSLSYAGNPDLLDGNMASSYLNLKNYDENIHSNINVNENLRFTYRNDYIEAIIGGSTNYSKSFNSISEQDAIKATWTNTITSSFMARFGETSTLSTDANYVFYKNFAEGYNDPKLIWNASFQQQIFQGKATIALAIYDILNQQTNVSRTDTERYIQDSRSNTLGRYIMFSFTYRFGTFGGQNGGRGGRGGGFSGGMRGGMGGGFGGGMREEFL